MMSILTALVSRLNAKSIIFDVDGVLVELTRKPIKNVHLRIYPPDGIVKMTAPLRFSEQKIHAFLQEKRDWIHTKRASIITRHVDEQTNQMEDRIPFIGKQYQLSVVFHNGPSNIHINGKFIYCYAPQGYNSSQIHQLIDLYYRKEMCALLPDLFKHWEAIIGVKCNEWGIKKMKTRWGSCNTQVKRIWLNLNLMKKPLICLEYVLVHELVHLLEASHNKRFYRLMTQFMPQWREYKYLLEN